MRYVVVVSKTLQLTQTFEVEATDDAAAYNLGRKKARECQGGWEETGQPDYFVDDIVQTNDTE